MSNDPNQPGQPGWRFDPQTGQPINPDPQPANTGWHFDPQTGQPVGGQPAQPAQPGQPEAQPAYTPPTTPQYVPPQQPYTPPQGTDPAYTAQQDPYAAPPTQPYAPPTQPQYAPPTQPYTQQPQPQPQQPYAPPQQVNVAAKRGSRTPLIIGGVVVLLLLAGAAVGAYLFLNKVINQPTVAVERVLPANVLGYFQVNPSLSNDERAALDKMKDAFQSQPGFKEAWAKLSSQASSMGGALNQGTPAPTPDVSDFDALTSYLGGNVTIAMLPPSTSDLDKIRSGGSSGEDMQKMVTDVLGNNVVGIVDLDFNPLNKKGPLPDFKQASDSGKLTVVENYRGMDIRKYITGTTTLYFTLLDNSSTAVVGGQVAPLHTVMDQYKDNKGLKDDSNFKALSGKLPSDRLATLYLNLSQIYTEIGLLSPDAVNSVKGVDGAMILTLSAHDDGIQVDVASQVDFSAMGSGSNLAINAQAKPDVSTLSDIPTDALGFLVSTDLQTVIKNAIQTVRSQGSDESDMVNSVEQSVKEVTGQDLEQDILPLLSGDYVLSVSPSSGSASSGSGSSPISPFILQIKLKSGDGPKAQQIIDYAMQKISSEGSGETPEKLSIGGGTFYKVPGEGGIAVGVVGDRVVASFDPIGAAGDPSTDITHITSGLGKGVGSTDAWKNESKHLPVDSNAIFFLDITGIRGLAEKSMDSDMKQTYESDYAPLVRPIKYLLIGSATSPQKQGNLSLNHTVIFLGVSK